MGKLENNKQQKRTSLLDTAFKLFTTQGVSKTSIAEISQKAGIAKGTFYLYFKDKYDIRNKLVSHEASKLFKNAVSALELHIKEQQINDHSFTITFTEEIIFIADHIINVLNTNQTLLTFISKNLSCLTCTCTNGKYVCVVALWSAENVVSSSAGLTDGYL